MGGNVNFGLGKRKSGGLTKRREGGGWDNLSNLKFVFWRGRVALTEIYRVVHVVEDKEWLYDYHNVPLI